MVAQVAGGRVGRYKPMAKCDVYAGLEMWPETVSKVRAAPFGDRDQQNIVLWYGTNAWTQIDPRVRTQEGVDPETGKGWFESLSLRVFVGASEMSGCANIEGNCVTDGDSCSEYNLVRNYDPSQCIDAKVHVLTNPFQRIWLVNDTLDIPLPPKGAEYYWMLKSVMHFHELIVTIHQQLGMEKDLDKALQIDVIVDKLGSVED